MLLPNVSDMAASIYSRNCDEFLDIVIAERELRREIYVFNALTKSERKNKSKNMRSFRKPALLSPSTFHKQEEEDPLREIAVLRDEMPMADTGYDSSHRDWDSLILSARTSALH